MSARHHNTSCNPTFWHILQDEPHRITLLATGVSTSMNGSIHIAAGAFTTTDAASAKPKSAFGATVYPLTRGLTSPYAPHALTDTPVALYLMLSPAKCVSSRLRALCPEPGQKTSERRGGGTALTERLT